MEIAIALLVLHNFKYFMHIIRNAFAYQRVWSASVPPYCPASIEDFIHISIIYSFSSLGLPHLRPMIFAGENVNLGKEKSY